MFWAQPRRVLILCALLDLGGIITTAALLDRSIGTDLIAHPAWLLPFATGYVGFSWLFGSYTLLRWPQLRRGQVALRLGVSALVTGLAVVVASWLLQLPPGFSLARRHVLIALIAPLTLWALLVRIVLQRQARRRRLPLPTLLATAEVQHQRLLPAYLPEGDLSLASLPWADPLSVQRQLKRGADVVVALLLLLLASPLIALAGLAIWLEDRGPVFYVQERSGLMGRVFRLYKLRTMRQADPAAPASWTRRGDARITRSGWLLRRVRLDELPQLLNVLRGEMSLIGPRPERPELEHALEARIPHYRKRHWMPPGLSGWAQVCFPYAASVEEAEEKLSYDLYYLRHWSVGLDLLILLKTIKTVLKAKGR